MQKKLLTLSLIFAVGIAAVLMLYRPEQQGVRQNTVALATAQPTASPTAVPTEAPTPSPTPAPTPIPFSYYAPTTAMDFSELVGDNGYYEGPLGYPAADTYRVTVDIAHQVVMVHAKDAEGNYTIPVRYMLCSTGLNDRTPKGIFHMKRYRVRFGLFQNDKTYGQYWTLINGRIYFHSTLYVERDANTYIGETYDLLGQPASHGCIRVPVPDARFIYYNLAYGTEVEIREGDPNDKETAAIRAQLILAEQPKERITLTAGEIPDTDNWSISDVPLEIPFLEGTQKGQEG